MNEKVIFEAIVKKAEQLDDKSSTAADAYLLNTIKASATLLKHASANYGVVKLAEEITNLTAYYTDAYGDAEFAKMLTEKMEKKEKKK